MYVHLAVGNQRPNEGAGSFAVRTTGSCCELSSVSASNQTPSFSRLVCTLKKKKKAFLTFFEVGACWITHADFRIALLPPQPPNAEIMDMPFLAFVYRW